MANPSKGLVFNLKTLGAALAIGGVAKLVSDQYEAIGTMKDLADKTGISVEKIGGLELVAREAGVSMSTLEKGLVKFNSEMGLQGDVALRSWIEKTSKLTTAQERLAAATAMFGSKGSDMVRLVQGGVAAFDEAQKAAEMSGYAVSAATAMGVDRALESYERLKDNVGGIFRSMASESWPYLQALVDGTQSLINNAGGGKAVGKFISDVLVHMAKSVVDMIQEMTNLAAISFHGLQALVVEFRSSIAGKAMGAGYGSAGAELRARGGLGKSYDNVEAYINRPKWSAGIDKMVEAATAAAAKAVADASLKGPGLFEGLIGDAKKYAMGSAQSWAGAGMGLWGAASGGFSKMAMADKSLASIGQRPAFAGLSAQDPLSREGNSQRVRSLAQNGQKIAEKQLKTQEQIRDEMRMIRREGVQFAAAGI